MAGRGAVIYPRVSSRKQATEGHSIEFQLRHCREQALALELPIVAECPDAGVSGAKFFARPGIQTALQLIEAGKADHLIVYAIDRAARDIKIGWEIYDRIKKARARLVVANGMIFDGSPTSDLQFSLFMSVGQFERAMIAKRSADGRRSAALQGRQPNRIQDPYGYHIIRRSDVTSGLYAQGTEGTYVLIPEQAEVVQRIFRLYDEGQSFRKIGILLTNEGIPSPRGRPGWKFGTLRNIIENPTYKGQAPSQRYRHVSDETRLARGLKTDRVVTMRPPEEWILIDCPTIVDEDLWGRCQARRRLNVELFNGRPSPHYLLSGILRCPKCRRPMVGSHVQHRWYYYHCKRHRDYLVSGAQRKCNGKQYRLPDCDRAVIEALEALARNPHAFEMAVEAYVRDRRVQERDDGTDRADQIHAELERLAARERAAVEAQIHGLQAGASPAVYAAVFASLASERKRLQERLALAENRPAAERILKTPEEQRNVVLSAVTRVLRSKHCPTPEKKQALSRIVQYVLPEEDGCTIALRGVSESGYVGSTIGRP